MLPLLQGTLSRNTQTHHAGRSVPKAHGRGMRGEIMWHGAHMRREPGGRGAHEGLRGRGHGADSRGVHGVSSAQAGDTELLPGPRLLLSGWRGLVVTSRGHIGQQLLQLGHLLLRDVASGEEMVQQTRVTEQRLDRVYGALVESRLAPRVTVLVTPVIKVQQFPVKLNWGRIPQELLNCLFQVCVFSTASVATIVGASFSSLVF